MIKLGLKDRFDLKWNKDPVSNCWLWKAAISSCGYGLMKIGPKQVGAHRISRLLYKNDSLDIASRKSGMVWDHICDVKICVNPDHLNLVTIGENVNRSRVKQTTCKKGHPFNEENTRTTSTGSRNCIKCCRISARLRYMKKRSLKKKPPTISFTQLYTDDEIRMAAIAHAETRYEAQNPEDITCSVDMKKLHSFEAGVNWLHQRLLGEK